MKELDTHYVITEEMDHPCRLERFCDENDFSIDIIHELSKLLPGEYYDIASHAGWTRVVRVKVEWDDGMSEKEEEEEEKVTYQILVKPRKSDPFFTGNYTDKDSALYACVDIGKSLLLDYTAIVQVGERLFVENYLTY